MKVQKITAISKERRIAQSVLLLAIVILLKPFSNLFIAWGVRHISQALSTEPILFLRALLDPLVALGIAMQVAWLLARMALLSVADLSFVLPVTAIGYVISTLLGKIFLHEQVGFEQWLGVLFIFAGTICAGTSAPEAIAPEASDSSNARDRSTLPL